MQQNKVVGFGRFAQRGPKLDKFEKMLAKAGLAPADFASTSPLHDPLWLPSEEFEERKRIMDEVAAYENSCTGCGLADYHVYEGRDRHGFPIRHNAFDFIEWQRRRTYELLSQGVEVRKIAVEVFRDIDWILALKKEFNF
jgi:hypothetical protein